MTHHISISSFDMGMNLVTKSEVHSRHQGSIFWASWISASVEGCCDAANHASQSFSENFCKARGGLDKRLFCDGSRGTSLLMMTRC